MLGLTIRALYRRSSLRAAVGLLAIINFVGMWFTLLVPETAGKSLEELGGDNQPETTTISETDPKIDAEMTTNVAP